MDKLRDHKEKWEKPLLHHNTILHNRGQRRGSLRLPSPAVG